MTKNYIYLYGTNIFLFGLPYYFVSILLLKQLGFSFTEIATLSVITELFGSLFDLPLSYISSKIGYKKILIASNLLLLVAFMFLLFGKSPLIYLAAVCFGLSESLSSGVLNSYNFELIDDETAYKRFLKHLNTIKYLFIAVITISSPYLLNRHYRYPVILSMIFVGLSLLSLIRLPEIKGDSDEPSKRLTLTKLKSIPWELIILGVGFSTLIMISNSYAGVLLTEHGLSLDLLGIVLFFFNLAMALGNYLAIRFEISLFLPLLALLLFFQDQLLSQILIFMFMRLLNSSYNNHFYAKFNQAIENNRAVSWSIYNLLMSMSFMVSEFLAGIFADQIGLKSNYLIFSLASLFCLLPYLVVKKLLTKRLR